MNSQELPVNQILPGDCIEILGELPENCIDVIFADPPYNLQLKQELWRPNMTRVEAVNEAWDQFSSFQVYDEFTYNWLSACRRVLKDSGTLWVIGTYHNIYRVGKIMQDLGFWILNDVIWVKTNPMPNFRGVRFTNAHETLLWASKNKDSRYTFNYHAMKSLNEDLQMRSDWILPICSGSERIRINGKKAHATQKPEALLYRVLLSSTEAGDIVLDPFFGSGTTGAVAKKLHRRWIGVELEQRYIEIALAHIADIHPEPFTEDIFAVQNRKQRQVRISFGNLLENGLLKPGQKLFFRQNREQSARIKPDGKLILQGFEGSIHQSARYLVGGSPCNGWEHWYYETQSGQMNPIDDLRQQMRKRMSRSEQPDV